MHRNVITRIFAVILVLLTIISLMSVAALAATPGSFPSLGPGATGSEGTFFADYHILKDVEDPYDTLFTPYYDAGALAGSEILTPKDGKVTFKPAQLVEQDGKLYDLQGVEIVPAIAMMLDENNTNNLTSAQIKEANAWLKKSAENAKTSVTIPLAPDPADYDDSDAFQKAFNSWLENYSYLILAIYGPHQHVLTKWRRDNNNHWSDCKVCKKQFVVINWHSDHDEDDFCDVCGHEIVYYDIAIKDVEGVKVTIDGDRDMTAPYRDWIEVSVEAEEGYQVTDVRVWKIRQNGTKNQITRHIVKRGSEYKFEMQNFDCEIVPTVIKK